MHHSRLFHSHAYPIDNSKKPCMRIAVVDMDRCSGCLVDLCAIQITELVASASQVGQMNYTHVVAPRLLRFSTSPIRMFQSKRKLVKCSGLRGWVEYPDRWTFVLFVQCAITPVGTPCFSYTIVLSSTVCYKLHLVPIYPGEGAELRMEMLEQRNKTSVYHLQASCYPRSECLHSNLT